MAYDFEGQTAIVTGAASGIGRKTAEQFAADGATVVVTDVDDTEGGAETVERIEAAGRTATFVETDVSDGDDVEAMVQEAVDAYGGVDVAVNNAGIEGETEPLADLSEDAWDQVLDVNLKGLWLCMKHELRNSWPATPVPS